MKKKMSIGVALLLALLYMAFGIGSNDSSVQTTEVIEVIVQEVETLAEESEAIAAQESEAIAAQESEAIAAEESEALAEEESEAAETEDLESVLQPESEVLSIETESESETEWMAETPVENDQTEEEELLPVDGTYTSKEEVALYIYQYGELPYNFMTKKEAEDLGWEGGSLEPYAPGMCIGGSKFGNYEGLLPEKKGRTYYECDIDTLGASKRGAKRIVYSNDGLIYYTDDHYESFELLYGEEE